MNRNNIDNIIKRTPYVEDIVTKGLFHLTLTIKKQGFLTKEQAIKILRWKSSRPLPHYIKNSNEDFKNVTKLAFKQKDEKIRIHILTALIGVKYPTASALLMFYDSKKYPIIDIRVWKLLNKNGLLTGNTRGQNFTLSQWEVYLIVIRQLAKKHKLSARQVEKRLFDFDKANQKGILYKIYQKNL